MFMMKCYGLKKIIGISKFVIFVVALCLKVFMFNAFAVIVQQDPIGIYCIKDNGVKAVSEWVEIDFEGDYYLEHYYFDFNGYLIMNGITPDGYVVNERGQWIVNGIVQRKHYEVPKSSKTTSDRNNASVTNNQSKEVNNNDIGSLTIVFLIGVILIVVILTSMPSGKTEYKRKSHKYYTENNNYDTSYKPRHTRKTTNSNDTTVNRSLFWHLRTDTDKIGEEGEDNVAEKLKCLEKEFIVLRNINLPRPNKDPVQIDFLCISNKGIFVIEVKNWLGMISGNYEDDIWRSEKHSIVREQKNPVKQNEWHIEVLKRFIRQNMTFYSIIVFTDRADIGWLDKKQHLTTITHINNLNNTIYNIYQNSDVKKYSNYKSVAGNLRKYTE